MTVNNVGHEKITNAKKGAVIYFPETDGYYMITSNQSSFPYVQAVNIVTGDVAFISPNAEVNIYRNCTVTLN